jgi:hypothetical protein
MGIACDGNDSEQAMMVANVVNGAYFTDTSLQPNKQTTVNINAQYRGIAPSFVEPCEGSAAKPAFAFWATARLFVSFS